MESKARTLAKAMTWQVIGLIVMTALAWWQTGSMGGAMTLALSANLCSIVTYVMHERIWSRVRWGRRLLG